jgi:transposase
MSPEYVPPYVKTQKTADRNAEVITEAATRPTMRFVELKTEEQFDMQTLPRIRDQLVGDRTSLMNQIRSFLLERGTSSRKDEQSSQFGWRIVIAQLLGWLAHSNEVHAHRARGYRSPREFITTKTRSPVSYLRATQHAGNTISPTH